VWLAKNEGKSLQEAIEGLGLKTVSQDELEAIVDKVVADNAELIRERGDACFGVLMGAAMKSLRGKADASQVGRALREKMKEKVK